jgi:hypothetical protein
MKAPVCCCQDAIGKITGVSNSLTINLLKMLKTVKMQITCQLGRQSGVNFTNILGAVFRLVESKSVKKIDNLTVFLRFWDLRL